MKKSEIDEHRGMPIHIQFNEIIILIDSNLQQILANFSFPCKYRVNQN